MNAAPRTAIERENFNFLFSRSSLIAAAVAFVLNPFESKIKVRLFDCVSSSALFHTFSPINHLSMDVRSSQQCFLSFIASYEGKKRTTSWKNGWLDFAFILTNFRVNFFSSLEYIFDRKELYATCYIQCKLKLNCIRFQLIRLCAYTIPGNIVFWAQKHKKFKIDIEKLIEDFLDLHSVLHSNGSLL